MYLQGTLYKTSGFQDAVSFAMTTKVPKILFKAVLITLSYHIDVRHHSVQDIYEQGRLKPKYISTDVTPGDPVTKGLTTPKSINSGRALGLIPDCIRNHPEHLFCEEVLV